MFHIARASVRVFYGETLDLDTVQTPSKYSTSLRICQQRLSPKTPSHLQTIAKKATRVDATQFYLECTYEALANSIFLYNT